LTQKVGYETEDKIWRSYGILKNARILSITDFLNLTSAVRLGVSLGIIRDINIQDLNKWLFQGLPGHLNVLNTDINNEKEENILRARIIRSNLGG
jgi:protein arginine kinase